MGEVQPLFMPTSPQVDRALSEPRRHAVIYFRAKPVRTQRSPWVLPAFTLAFNATPDLPAKCRRA